MDWRSQAACLTVDPELFFPVGNTGPAIAQIAEAKAVCARCEVVDTCLKWALENGQDAGVWGGMSEDERRSLKRRAARARRSTRQQPIIHYRPPYLLIRRAFRIRDAVRRTAPSGAARSPPWSPCR